MIQNASMKTYGFVSPTAEKNAYESARRLSLPPTASRHPIANIYHTPTGRTVRVNFVGNSQDPKEFGCVYTDAVCVGEVTVWASAVYIDG